MKQFVVSITLVAIVASASSCSKTSNNDSDVNPIDRKITFEADIKPIMQNNCITCHGGLVPAAGLDLNAYANVRYAAENGQLIQRMNNNTSPMPPNDLLDSDIREMIDKWVADAYPEN